jgi:hypothetical protein
MAYTLLTKSRRLAYLSLMGVVLLTMQPVKAGNSDECQAVGIVAAVAAVGVGFAGFIGFLCWYFQETDEQFSDRLQQEVTKLQNRSNFIFVLNEQHRTGYLDDKGLLDRVNGLYDEGAFHYLSKEIAHLQNQRTLVENRIKNLKKPHVLRALQETQAHIVTLTNVLVGASGYVEGHRRYFNLKRDVVTHERTYGEIIEKYNAGNTAAVEYFARASAGSNPYPHVHAAAVIDDVLRDLRQSSQVVPVERLPQIKEMYSAINIRAQRLYSNLNSIKEVIVLHPEYPNEIKAKEQARLERERLALLERQTEAKEKAAQAQEKAAQAKEEQAKADRINAEREWYETLKKDQERKELQLQQQQQASQNNPMKPVYGSKAV